MAAISRRGNRRRSSPMRGAPLSGRCGRETTRNKREKPMKRIAFSFLAVVTLTCAAAWMSRLSLGQDNKESKQVIVTTIPPGYRDWKFISAAHEAGELNDIRVVIGNKKAMTAYRAGKPFPEGTIIGRAAWKLVP